MELRRAIAICTIFFGLLLTGCGGKSVPSYHISRDVDFSYIKKVAVLPLDNLSDDKAAARIVRQIVINELLASGFFDVVVPGEVLSVISNEGIKDISSLTAAQIKTIGSDLQVQAVIFGSVVKYGQARMGAVVAPEVTINLMMADTSSGTIIWSVTETSGGASFMSRHFGARADTMSESVMKVVRSAIDTFAEY